ncbi:MAG TPA: hypothetical protein VHC96_20350 [Puia sp.]|nr:hypothetical protein [Puia sp.]
MSQQETATGTTPTKKQVRKELADKLTGALADYKQELGEKKLATHVRKVSKLIGRDLLKVSKKKERTKKNAAKKTRTKAKAEKK